MDFSNEAARKAWFSLAPEINDLESRRFRRAIRGSHQQAVENVFQQPANYCGERRAADVSLQALYSVECAARRRATVPVPGTPRSTDAIQGHRSCDMKFEVTKWSGCMLA
jgi:hypothetical protein